MTARGPDHKQMTPHASDPFVGVRCKSDGGVTAPQSVIDCIYDLTEARFPARSERHQLWPVREHPRRRAAIPAHLANGMELSRLGDNRKLAAGLVQML